MALERDLRHGESDEVVEDEGAPLREGQAPQRRDELSAELPSRARHKVNIAWCPQAAAPAADGEVVRDAANPALRVLVPSDPVPAEPCLTKASCTASWASERFPPSASACLTNRS